MPLTQTDKRRGGQSTLERYGIRICSHCGQQVSTTYYRELGLKSATKSTITHEQRVAWGKLGGRGIRKANND